MNPKEINQLHDAVRKGNLSAVKKLLAAAGPQAAKKQLDYALYSAAVHGRGEVVDYLLAAGAKANHVANERTVLMAAAGNGDLPCVQKLIAAGADIHHRIKWETALSAAMANGRSEVVAHLRTLKATAPPEMLLFLACKAGDLAGVQTVLKDKPDLEQVVRKFSHPPLATAAWLGHTAIVECLLQHGANPNSRASSMTALGLAVTARRDLALIDQLVRAGADVNAFCQSETPLMIVARRGWLDGFNRLLELGADPPAVNQRGLGVMDLAEWGKSKEIIARLRELGVASPREAVRALTRLIAREYGGKSQEADDGFLINGKFKGLSCQFSLDLKAGSGLFHRLRPHDPELRKAGEAQLWIGRGQPDDSHETWQEVKTASRRLGLGVFHSQAEPGLSAKFVNEFCARHEQRIKDLALAAKEEFVINSDLICLEWRGVDSAKVMRRLETLATMALAIAKPPLPQRQLFAREWLLKPAAKGVPGAGVPVHQGGGPWEHPVACPECDRTTNLMVAIDLRDLALPENALGRERLPVFWCLTCLEWDPAFHELDASKQKPARAGSKTTAVKMEAGEADLPMTCVALIPQPAGKKASSKSKLGGKPVWLQEDETPDCPKCQKVMAFALQLTSGDQATFGDMGTLYAFVCEKCRVTASLVQSH